MGGVDLNGRHILQYRLGQTGKNLRFQRKNLVFGAKDFLLILLEFRGDVTLGIYQRLLAYPIGRHLVLECVAHLQVVAEHVVVCNLKAGDAGLLGLTLLDLHQVVLAAVGNTAQLVQLCIDSIGYYTAFAYQQRGIGTDGTDDIIAQGLAEVNLLAHLTQLRVLGRIAYQFDGLQLLECHTE